VSESRLKIGVFDSGFGGLTVLRALLPLLPGAEFLYLGDTARLPYGSKSRATIVRYALSSTRFLLDQGADFLVIACNTATALALKEIKDSTAVPVLGVIETGAGEAATWSKTREILVIGTDATISSHAYAAAARERGMRALEKACPLLVPLVEEGWTTQDPFALLASQAGAAQAGPFAAQVANQVAPQVAVTAEVLRIYLDELNTEAASLGMHPDTLVLGCTHYPLLKPLIQKAIPDGIQIIDSAESAADNLMMYISHGHAAPPAPTSDTVLRCFATDSVEKFERLGSRFLGRPTGPVELVDLGG
jgi:glutamate racemase